MKSDDHAVSATHFRILNIFFMPNRLTRIIHAGNFPAAFLSLCGFAFFAALASPRWDNPIAAWLFPLFLLYYTRIGRVRRKFLWLFDPIGRALCSYDGRSSALPASSTGGHFHGGRVENPASRCRRCLGNKEKQRCFVCFVLSFRGCCYGIPEFAWRQRCLGIDS